LNISGRASARHLTDRQRFSWLRLIRTENVGPASFRELINRFGSAESALEALPDLARKGGATRLPRIPSAASIEAELAQAGKCHARFIAIGEPDYPVAMRRMDHPPPLIAFKGNEEACHMPAIAMVGARNASLAGTKFARMLAAEFGKAGYVVASGLARGIDTAAHRGSLNTGTLAFLAGGIDRLYPPENVDLAAEITESGALISEMPFGWEPRAKDFPRRNRLIAGSALGLVVVEAALRSGSLISARLANEMGRLVFAVPGSPLDPRAAGANGLLKDGAILVTSAADVLEQLAPLTGAPPPPSHLDEPDAAQDLAGAPDMQDRHRLIECLGPTPVAIDEVIAHTGLRPAMVATILLELELAGRLERHSGGRVSMPVPGI
jgi:DNA processing protein